MGPAIPPACGGQRVDGQVLARCARRRRRAAATWSKNPSFSSYMMNSTVFAHTLGLETRALEHLVGEPLPAAGGEGGCSS